MSRGSYTGPTYGATYVSGQGWGASAGRATLSGSSSTDLARRLAPPEEPGDPKSYERSRIGPIMLVGFGVVAIGMVLALFGDSATVPAIILFGLFFAYLIWE